MMPGIRIAGIALLILSMLAWVGLAVSPHDNHEPRSLHVGALHYPAAALAAGLEGAAIVDCFITRSGYTKRCQVKIASDPAFGQAALDYARAARFVPALRYGVAFATPHHILSFRFRLPNRVMRFRWTFDCGVAASGSIGGCQPRNGARGAVVSPILRWADQMHAEPTRSRNQPVDDPDRSFDVTLVVSRLPLDGPSVSLPDDLSTTFYQACSYAAGVFSSCRRVAADGQGSGKGQILTRMDLGLSFLAPPSDPSPRLLGWSCDFDQSGDMTTCRGEKVAPSAVQDAIAQVLQGAHLSPRTENGRTVLDRRRTVLIRIDGTPRPAYRDNSIVVSSCDHMPGNALESGGCTVVATSFLQSDRDPLARAVTVTIAGLRKPLLDDVAMPPVMSPAVQ